MNNQRNQNSSTQTVLLIAAIAMLGYLIYLMSGASASSYRVVVEQPRPETGSVIIQEQPAVIIATASPPSVPVVVPVATAVPTVAEPAEAPTHPPLPGNMQEAHEQGYWPMPITPAQFEQCKIDPGINPACQFYVGGER